MADAKITSEVRDVLERSTITGSTLVLPTGQLDRKLYEAVNKVLVNAGGKWKKGTGHVFPSDPRPKLGLALETGVSKDEKKALQAFYTPPALAARLVALADVSGKTVLEPSCGAGALIVEALVQGAKTVDGIEVDVGTINRAALSTKEKVSVECEDFLQVKPWVKFDRVVMNPPFTKNQDLKHVAHALKFLKPGGRLVSIMSPNQNRSGFQDLVATRSHKIHEVEAGAFKESGTNIATIILVIDV